MQTISSIGGGTVFDPHSERHVEEMYASES